MYAVYANADPSTAREIQLSNTVIESGSMSFTLMEIPSFPFFVQCLISGSVLLI